MAELKLIFADVADGAGGIEVEGIERGNIGAQAANREVETPPLEPRSERDANGQLEQTGWRISGVTGASPSDVFTVATEFARGTWLWPPRSRSRWRGRIEFARFAPTYVLTEIPLMLCAIVVYRRSRRVR